MELSSKVNLIERTLGGKYNQRHIGLLENLLALLEGRPSQVSSAPISGMFAVFAICFSTTYLYYLPSLNLS